MKDYPVLKIIPLFICGIIVQKYFSLQPQIYFAVILTFSLILFAIIEFKIFEGFKTAASVISYLIFFILGAFVSQVNNEEKILLSPAVYHLKNITAFGTISNIELIREKEIIFSLDVDSLSFGNGTMNRKIKFICKLKDENRHRRDSVYNSILPGNFVSIKGNFYKAREMRNPGEFDYNSYLNSSGVSGILVAYHSRDIKTLNVKNDFYKTTVFYVRKYLDDQLKNLHNPGTATFLKGLLLGDRGEMDYETKIEFVNSGVVHVLSVSGLHVGYVVLIFIILFGRLNIFFRSFLTITGIIIFMMITGNPVAMFRASVMGAVIIIAFLTNRSASLFNSLAISALIILTISPPELYNPGFQLSFSAVFAMGALYPSLRRYIYSLKIKWKTIEYLLLFTALSFSAQIGTLPFTLLYFGKLSIASVAANILVIPLTGFIVGLGFFALAINFVLPSLAVYYGACNDLLTLILFKIVDIAGNPGFSFLWVRNFSAADAVIFYLFLVTLIFFYNRFKRPLFKIIFIAFIFLNTILFISLDDKDILSGQKLKIVAIDVGQGDAFLIKFPKGSTALIDAGNATAAFDNGERVILSLLDYLGVEKIDFAFVSHIDADHYAGFVSLVKAGMIRKIIKPQTDTILIKDIKFEKYLKENHVPIEFYRKKIMEVDDVKVYILNDDNIPGNNKLSSNDKSGVMKIVYGKTSFLFTGDIEKKIEKLYTHHYTSFLDSDILKASHHGSNTGSSPEFLNCVTPKQTIISAGLINNFGHPSPEVLKRLENFGSEIYRTDKYGALLFESNGDSIRFIDWKKEY